MKKVWVLSYPLSAPRSLRSDWADAQADLSLRWAHNHNVGFVMRRLKFNLFETTEVENGYNMTASNVNLDLELGIIQLMLQSNPKYLMLYIL